MWLQMLDERFLRSSMKSFRKIMCSTRSLTGTRSKSARVACPTSSRKSMVATNQSYRKRPHHQFWKHATAEDQLTVQCPEISFCGDNCTHVSLFGYRWLFDWLSDGLNEWLTDCLINHLMTGFLTDCYISWSDDGRVDLPTGVWHWLAGQFQRWLTLWS